MYKYESKPLSEPFETITWERDHNTNEAMAKLVELNDHLAGEVGLLRESISRIYIDIDNLGWSEFSKGNNNWDFDFTKLSAARSMSRLMYLQNPMVRRSVEVQQLYVWALGYTLMTNNEVIRGVLEGFLNDPKNNVEFSHTALTEKEIDLRTIGDIFLMYFITPSTGRVRVRSIDYEQIVDVYRNPKDPKEVWFYKRSYTLKQGSNNPKTVIVWYPDWKFKPQVRPDPREGRNDETVDWDTPISHIRVGGFSNMKFGFPEIYSILTWAKAYKRFLENWSTLMESYAVVAMQIVNQTKSGVAKAKSQLGSKPSTNGIIGDGNPPPGVASWAAFSGGGELKAVRTSGATTGAGEGHPLALMIAAGSGIPITFYGEADVGSMATATTLDRPTELKFVYRQKQWSEWMGDIFHFVLMQSAMAPEGVLRQAGVIVERELDIEGTYLDTMIWPASMDPHVHVTFPDITEPNATERVRALVMGITMMGKPMTDIIPDARVICQMLLRALGVKDAERLVNAWYPVTDKKTLPTSLNPEPANGLGDGDKPDDEKPEVV
jgi:hypothetical protein